MTHLPSSINAVIACKKYTTKLIFAMETTRRPIKMFHLFFLSKWFSDLTLHLPKAQIKNLYQTPTHLISQPTSRVESDESWLCRWMIWNILNRFWFALLYSGIQGPARTRTKLIHLELKSPGQSSLWIPAFIWGTDVKRFFDSYIVTFLKRIMVLNITTVNQGNRN